MESEFPDIEYDTEEKAHDRLKQIEQNICLKYGFLCSNYVTRRAIILDGVESGLLDEEDELIRDWKASYSWWEDFYKYPD